jgi:hypothetical protein
VPETFFDCPCGQQFAVTSEDADGRARCPACGRELSTIEPVPPPALPPEPTPVLDGRPVGGKGRNRSRNLVIAGVVLGVIGCLIGFERMMAAERSARMSSIACSNNLRQVGLALNEYHAANGRLPPAAISDQRGKPLLSWRVAILPYLGKEELYAAFHLDESWDSPHNLALLNQMPHEFGCPADIDAGPGKSGYRALVGRGTAFEPDFKPVRFGDFADGVDETILIGESRLAVPWTKPEDLYLDTGGLLRALGSRHAHDNIGFNVVFADGAVRRLRRSIDPKLLAAVITRDRNERVSRDTLE